MTAENQSKLKLYSYGRVAENKPTSTDVALVIPIEILPLLDGELAVEDTELETTGVDEEGKTYTVKVVTRQAIKCRWLQWGSNRKSSPDVRRDERVAIYRFGDSDLFYWVSLGLDDHLRRLETVIYRFSNLPDGLSDDELDIDNCHVLEINSHKKLINLTTSKSNGEAFAYTFQFNLAESCVTLSDNDDTWIELDSAETKVTLHNKDLTEISLNKRDITMYAPDNFIFKCDANYTLDVGGDFITTVGGDYKNTVKGNVTYKCTDWLNKSDTFKVDSPTAEFTGSLKVAGGITGGAGLNITGASSFGGAMSANGITSSKTIQGPRDSI